MGKAKVIALPGTAQAESGDRRKRILAQALRDPFFGSAYPYLRSVKALEKAGFVDLGDRAGKLVSVDESWMMTPTYQITRRLKELGDRADSAPLVVLLTTGGFCPVHEGHIKMMAVAKAELESRGEHVLGGYMAPDHDSYVLRKNGRDAMSAIHRLRLLEETLKNSDWLMSDGWASLGVERDVNFSDVIIHLERYLAKHIKTPRPIEVVYVFGGDNAPMARAFLGHGRCVCVARPGVTKVFDQVARNAKVAATSRIIFTRQETLEMSSSAVRQGRAALAEGLDAMYRKWTKLPGLLMTRHATYYLRYEDGWAVEPWYVGRDAAQISREYRMFSTLLMRLLKHAHKRARDGDIQVDADFRVQYLSDQRERAASLRADLPVISLDPCIKGDYDLAVSRLFPVSSARIIPGITARPGHAPIEVQARDIPPGDYVLSDDDIFTGGTMRNVEARLPKTVRIVRRTAFAERDRAIDDVLDILDCRDFLIGSREGGLVVELPDGTLGRAPYCLPYVSPAHGASTPLSQELQVSREIWQLNKRFFSRIKPAIRLSETNIGFRNMMNKLGFSPSTLLTEICQWHIERAKIVERCANASSGAQ